MNVFEIVKLFENLGSSSANESSGNLTYYVKNEALSEFPLLQVNIVN